VRTGFLALAADEPDRFAVVDATFPVDEVADEVWSIVAEMLARTSSEPKSPVSRITS